MSSPDSVPADAPAPRLCHLRKIPTFDGYGFNLHAEKSKPGQFIGKVDPNSPAEQAGMLEGDRIVEVNGVNIANENHRQVVERIKSVPDETKLLVVDSETDAWYREQKIVPRSTQKNVKYIQTPMPHATNQVVENGSVPHKGEGEELPADAPVPRLCHLVKWNDFEGYGFNLHAEKGKMGQFVGKIDPGSPAEHAGLLEGDRIIEVNGVNILSETHRQIVDRIKQVPDETQLLVLDADAEKWYKSHGIVASSKQANVLRIKSPESNPATARKASETEKDEEKEAKEQVESKANVKAETPLSSEEHAEATVDNPSAKEEVSQDVQHRAEAAAVSEELPQTEVSSKENHTEDKTDLSAERADEKEPREEQKEESKEEQNMEPPQKASNLNLNMSASEMRKLLAQRKKHDPKKVSMDLKKKYELIEQM